MIVVSNTSPIAALAGIGQLQLITELYGEVSVPIAVQLELATRDVRVSQLKGFVVREAPVLPPSGLDRGEAEAIALAIGLRADLILMDELAGRKAAVAAGLNVTGTLGILSRAKQGGLIAECAPLIEVLRTRGRFFLDDELCGRFLRSVGEEYP